MTAEKKPRKKAVKPAKPEATPVSMETLNLDAIPVSHLSDAEVSALMKVTMARLMERADLDTMRICATSIKDGSTHYYSVGSGNLYAQVGAAQEWLNDIMDSMDGLGMGGPNLQGPHEDDGDDD